MNAKLDRRAFVKTVGAAAVLGPSALACGCPTPTKPTEFQVEIAGVKPREIEGVMVWSGLEQLPRHTEYPTFRTTGKHSVTLRGKQSLFANTKTGCNETGDGSIEKPFKTWQHAAQVISM